MWRWLLAPAPLCFLFLALVVIRRKWPLYVAFIFGILYTAPTWVALLLLTLFFRRSEYLAPLVAAVVVSAITSSLMLVLGGRFKNWVVGDQANLSRTTGASFRYPFSTMISIVLIVGFGLPVTQFSSEVRAKAIVAFGVTAIAILVACFLFERSQAKAITRRSGKH
jgi:hypothetical protein